MAREFDLEREREKARIKLRQDELSRLHSAREEGYLMGTIRVYLKLLHLPEPSLEELKKLTWEELQELETSLLAQLSSKSSSQGP